MSGPEQTAIILLAAGESSRMGQPKQLLRIDGKTLLRHATEEAINANIGPVIVVLGAFATKMKPEFEGLDVNFVVNKGWKEGMGSSIRCGIQELQKHTNQYTGAIIMLADQPYADAKLLNNLLHTFHSSQKPIVASAYKKSLGVPAYFHYSYFMPLSQLEGHIGARKLIQQHTQHVASISFPLGGMDIDTPDDYKKIKEMMAGKG